MEFYGQFLGCFCQSFSKHVRTFSVDRFMKALVIMILFVFVCVLINESPVNYCTVRSSHNTENDTLMNKQCNSTHYI